MLIQIKINNVINNKTVSSFNSNLVWKFCIFCIENSSILGAKSAVWTNSTFNDLNGKKEDEKEPWKEEKRGFILKHQPVWSNGKMNTIHRCWCPGCKMSFYRKANITISPPSKTKLYKWIKIHMYLSLVFRLN